MLNLLLISSYYQKFYPKVFIIDQWSVAPKGTSNKENKRFVQWLEKRQEVDSKTEAKYNEWVEDWFTRWSTKLYATYLRLNFITDCSDFFEINPEQEVYERHYFIVSATYFKYNYKYYGVVSEDDKTFIYYPGRWLLIDDTHEGKTIRRSKVPVDIAFLRVIYAGRNAYKVLDSDNVVHFLSYSPAFTYYYKQMLEAIKEFFELEELSLRFVYMRFRHSPKKLKKIRSVKKNLRKKLIAKNKLDDYNLVSL